MNIQPRFRGFICTNAHPEGCAQQVKKQIEYIQAKPRIHGPKKVLVIGSSKGFGLASRIVSTFGAGADTIGVFSGKASKGKRTASAGWYNTVSFEQAATKAGYYAKSVNGDAFSNEVKDQVIELIKQELKQVDLVIYSLAASRRIDPETGEVYQSVLKPIGDAYISKTVDFHTGEVSKVRIEPATEQEIEQTVKVMGGEDWKAWILALKKANVLAKGAITVAFSYIGPELTHPIYRDGTIGKAKDHLEKTANELRKDLEDISGQVFVSVNKAVVTQSSSAIPVVPLYISILYKVMKEKGLHESCIEHIDRLFREKLYSGYPVKLDHKGRIRLDDLEMRSDVQEAVKQIWDQVNTENIRSITDLEGYRKEFFQLFGFETQISN